jgi:hypothetical protein
MGAWKHRATCWRSRPKRQPNRTQLVSIVRTDPFTCRRAIPSGLSERRERANPNHQRTRTDTGAMGRAVDKAGCADACPLPAHTLGRNPKQQHGGLRHQRHVRRRLDEDERMGIPTHPVAHQRVRAKSRRKLVDYSRARSDAERPSSATAAGNVPSPATVADELLEPPNCPAGRRFAAALWLALC